MHGVDSGNQLSGVKSIAVVDVDRAQDNRTAWADQISRRNRDKPLAPSRINGRRIPVLEVKRSELDWQGVGDSVGNRHFHPLVDQCRKGQTRRVRLGGCDQFRRWGWGNGDYSPAGGTNLLMSGGQLGQAVVAVRAPGAAMEVHD